MMMLKNHSPVPQKSVFSSTLTNFLLQNAENGIHFSQQEAQGSAGLSRLQVAAGFSWDVGLNSLKPLSAVQESESSDEEEPDQSNKVKQIETLC